MVKLCCVKSCRSESYIDCGISFHRFPRDEQLRAKWIKAIGGKITCKDPFICSLHFKIEDYKTTPFLRRLNVDAVPKLEDDTDEPLQDVHETEVVNAEDTVVVKTEETVVYKAEPDEFTEEDDDLLQDLTDEPLQSVYETEVVNAEDTVVVKTEETVVIKAEPDEFTEEEDDLLEKLENKRKREEEAKQTELKKPKLDNVYVIPIERRVKVPIEKDVSSTSGCDKNVMVSEIYMKTMLRTQNEFSDTLKNQVLMQNPDLKQLTFLRFLDARMQTLSEQRRKELRDKITEMVLQESDLEE